MFQNLDTRIAIIGAGASGLTAALELKDSGFKNVVVYEEEDRVGGKTLSQTYKGVAYELGSMMFSRADEVGRLADRFGVAYKSFETKDFYYSDGKYLDPIAYARKSYSWFEILRSFYHLRNAVKSNRLEGAGYHDLDPDVFQNFQTYLKAHHLEAAALAFKPGISGLGYGYFETTPALYGLKFITSILGASLISSLLLNGKLVCYFPGGWMELWQKIAATLDVRTGSRISAITRTKAKGICISVNGKTDCFDKLIVTTPLNRVDAYLDVTKREQDLFCKIQSHRMISTLVESSISLRTMFFADNATQERIGHVIGVQSYVTESRCSVVFQTVPEGMSDEKIRRFILEDLRELGCTVRKIVTQKDWDYFYHVSSSDLANGFYEKLNALQGVRNTYYLGSILNYETVAHCQQFAKYLVETYF